MDFNLFKEAVERQFERMTESTLYKVQVDKTTIWDTYLNSFPEGSNPIYRERTHHDCQCCKQFIRNVGNVVAIIDNKPVSVWSCTVEDENYQAVADAMAILVEGAPIDRPFFHYENRVGTPVSHQSENGEVITWEHFAVNLPSVAVMAKDAIATHISKLSSSQAVFKRSLEEINQESVNTVLELVGQKSLYRGEEHKALLQTFRKHLQKYADLTTSAEKEYYCWSVAMHGRDGSLRVRNSAIGTLLVDLSEGKSLERAVGAFEAMVAPDNYKRPKALITTTMIKKAQEKVQELGFTESLSRRHATPEDITINNVIFANRNAVKAMDGDIFDQLLEEQVIDPKSLENAEEIAIEDFINTLPEVDSIQLFVENRIQGNLMTLIAPAVVDAPNMLKWDNNFCWTYNGEVADSMKQHVKAAGGKVDGILRFSIMWNEGEFNGCDYDAHCHEPGGHIFFGTKRIPSTGGNLDVDIIDPKRGKPAVENITWAAKHKMLAGDYKFSVHCYSARQGNTGFTAEFEDNNGNLRQYEYNKSLRQNENVQVVSGHWDGDNFTVHAELPSTVSSREVWGMQTMQFREVSMLMYSPNHWDDNNVGNRHYFFILEGCNQPGDIRGFYNEFLTDDLRDHRKVFEVLGSKMKVKESEHQLSGLGFSTTQRNHVFCRVTGSVNRTFKLTF